MRQRGDRLGRRGRPEHGLRGVAGQNVHDREHHHRGDEERGREQDDPLNGVSEHSLKLARKREAATGPHELFPASPEATRKEISAESARARRISASRAARKSLYRSWERS